MTSESCPLSLSPLFDFLYLYASRATEQPDNSAPFIIIQRHGVTLLSARCTLIKNNKQLCASLCIAAFIETWCCVAWGEFSSIEFVFPASCCFWIRGWAASPAACASAPAAPITLKSNSPPHKLYSQQEKEREREVKALKDVEIWEELDLNLWHQGKCSECKCAH